jgi:formate dehydrogenase subunit delta
MSFNYPEKLVGMANQISRAFAYQGPERAPASIAEHLRLFWNPSMRTRLKNYIAEGHSRLDPLALEATGLIGDVSVQAKRGFAV